MTGKPIEGKVIKFRRERKLYKIDFEDPDLQGFEVLMKGVSLERFIEVTELSSRLSEPGGQTRENVEAQYQMLADQIVSWNYADEDGEEYPADYDGLKRLEVQDVNKILQGWMQAMAGVPKDSKSGSPYGGTSEELSLGLGSASSALGS